MTIIFDCPTGAVRDLKELEYLSALLQTNMQHLRSDGTIKASDIVLYIRSRHGLVVQEDLVQQLILKELAGQTMDVESDVIDLCQLTAILLIPQLLEAASDENRLEEVFGKVHEDIASIVGYDGLKRDRLRSIFAMHDDLAVSDDLLDEMIAAAGSGSRAFILALTGDLARFNLEWQSSYTTNFNDATKGLVDGQATISNSPPAELELEDGPTKKSDSLNTFKPLRMLGFVDYISDGFRRPLFVMILWTCFVNTYFAYVFGFGGVRELYCFRGPWTNSFALHVNTALTCLCRDIGFK